MKDVSLFIPCTVDLFLPRIGEATVSLLRRVGVNPIYHEEQTCCGQPAINAGYQEEARKVAKHFISVFGEDEVVVSPSGSCVCTVKYHYPELWRMSRVGSAGPRSWLPGFMNFLNTWWTY